MASISSLHRLRLPRRIMALFLLLFRCWLASSQLEFLWWKLYLFLISFTSFKKWISNWRPTLNKFAHWSTFHKFLLIAYGLFFCFHLKILKWKKLVWLITPFSELLQSILHWRNSLTHWRANWRTIGATLMHWGTILLPLLKIGISGI